MTDFESLMDPDYSYPATVIDVYDGDTVTCSIDLGFNMFTRQKIRLCGIDTPELRGDEREDGLRVKQFVKELLLNQEIRLYTIKNRTGKYGRYVGIIVHEGVNVNQLLLNNGMAQPYKEK